MAGDTLPSGVTYVSMLVTLLLVAAYAIHSSRSMNVTNLTNFLSAKNSQPAIRLAWCFFASGMGSWTLFSFPQIGVQAGSWGVIGYTLSGVLGLLVLAIVGPFSRSVLGDGMTLSDYIRTRFGRPMQILVFLASVFYQFISLTSELTCVGDLTLILSPNAHPFIPILAVAVITNIYLLIGGLRASLATDVWQGIGVVSLVSLVCLSMFIHVKIPQDAWTETKIAAFTTAGFETLITLCIAITASNLFYTGYWQRVFAANDDATLKRALIYASMIIIPFTIILALSGMVSQLAYPGKLVFFSILLDMGTFWKVLVACVIASLASSVADSIQMGIAAEIVSNYPQINMTGARIICVLLNIPAIIIALKHYNILTLFLIADLVCTAIVGPMLLSAWKRTHSIAAFIGAIAGLLTVVAHGWYVQGSLWGGIKWFGLPEGLYSYNSMLTFILTAIIPSFVTIMLSLVLPQEKQPPYETIQNDTYDPVKSPARDMQRVV